MRQQDQKGGGRKPRRGSIYPGVIFPKLFVKILGALPGTACLCGNPSGRCAKRSQATKTTAKPESGLGAIVRSTCCVQHNHSWHSALPATTPLILSKHYSSSTSVWGRHEHLWHNSKPIILPGRKRFQDTMSESYYDRICTLYFCLRWNRSLCQS